jgi:hypothetical protein
MGKLARILQLNDLPLDFIDEAMIHQYKRIVEQEETSHFLKCKVK